MIGLVRQLVRRLLAGIDALYRRAHGLQSVGPLLYVGVHEHRGTTIELTDGTRIDAGAVIGRLHFNNARASAVAVEGRLQAGVRFARLLRQSFAELAALVQGDQALANVQLFEGVTWFRPHGTAVGFQTEPVAPGLRKRWLTAYFRLLIWGFAPVAQSAAMSEVEPRVFRISRRALVAHFAGAARATGT